MITLKLANVPELLGYAYISGSIYQAVSNGLPNTGEDYRSVLFFVSSQHDFSADM
jgi:hypothetical protein